MLNLLITAVGRDLLSLIGLVAVMVVQDPVMSFFSFVVAPPAMLDAAQADPPHPLDRRSAVHGGTRILETLQETLQGIRIVKAFTLEDTMRERFDAERRRGRARSQQDGARRQPRQPDDGDARRLRDRDRARLWRLPRRS